MKIIALLGRAYTGKTAIVKALEEQHGYAVASFTDYLKWLTCYAVNAAAPARMLSVEEIVRDKAKLRRLVQEFGSVIGFETDSSWIEQFISDTTLEYPNPEQKIVIDCLRSKAQVMGARRMGAAVVGVDATLLDRYAFAAATIGGRLDDGRELVDAADEHPIDGTLNLAEMGVQVRVINSYRTTVESVAHEIACWAEGAEKEAFHGDQSL